jgi:hypothetical protein
MTALAELTQIGFEPVTEWVNKLGPSRVRRPCCRVRQTAPLPPVARVHAPVLEQGRTVIACRPGDRPHYQPSDLGRAPSPILPDMICGRDSYLGHRPVRLALYGSAYLLPQYLAVTQGFDAEQSGEVVAWTGLPQLFVIPLVPLLMKRIDIRLLVGTGLVIFVGSCFVNLELDLNYAAPQLFWPDIVRAVSQAIVMTPISAIAMVGIAPNEAVAASGLFNMMRNLGGAIGTAAVETFFTKREQFHSFIINAHVSLLQPATCDQLAQLQRYFMAHGFPRPGWGAAPRRRRRRRRGPRAGDDHGLRRLLRLARGRPARRHPSGGNAEKGRRLRRARTLNLSNPFGVVAGARSRLSYVRTPRKSQAKSATFSICAGSKGSSPVMVRYS